MVNFNEVSIDFLLNIGLNLTNAQKVHNVLTSHPSLVTFTQKTNFQSPYGRIRYAQLLAVAL